MSVSVNKPTNSQVDSWWKFALKFPQTASAFKNGIGANFESVANPNQPSNQYCLTCTAGNGGNDATPRKLKKKYYSRKRCFCSRFCFHWKNSR